MKNIEFYYNELLSASSIYWFCVEHGMNMTECDNDFYDVIKWLNEEYQILDETEKRYLGNIIRPLKTKYTTISKNEWPYKCEKYEYLFISELCDNAYGTSDLVLPKFVVGTMYKGMKAGKEYTLEELGL